MREIIIIFMFNKIIHKFALYLHILHRDIYSRYKVNSLDTSPEKMLTSLERTFYLELYPFLREKNTIFYDIGAAQGTVSSCLAKLPNISEVYAFEPNPELYQKLLLNVGEDSKIFCHNVALGSVDGSISLNISDRSHSSSILPIASLHVDQFPGSDFRKKVDVQIFRLDNYVSQKQLPMPNLIKIDVQGYELNILNGAVDTIRHAKYCILEMSFQELYLNAPLFEDVYRYMIDMGFKLVGVSAPLRGKTYDQLQVDGYFENQFPLKN
jgi:FkbM family methyltransferase